jgi:hypothetical protein
MNPQGIKTFRMGRLLIDIADFLDTRVEQSSLVVFYPESDLVSARFSIISAPFAGAEVPHVVANLIRERAEMAEVELHEEEHLVWYHTSEPAEQEAPGSLVHSWVAGVGGHIVVVTCSIEDLPKDEADAKRVLESISTSVLSIRPEPGPVDNLIES